MTLAVSMSQAKASPHCRRTRLTSAPAFATARPVASLRASPRPAATVPLSRERCSSWRGVPHPPRIRNPHRCAANSAYFSDPPQHPTGRTLDGSLRSLRSRCGGTAASCRDCAAQLHSPPSPPPPAPPTPSPPFRESDGSLHARQLRREYTPAHKCGGRGRGGNPFTPQSLRTCAAQERASCPPRLASLAASGGVPPAGAAQPRPHAAALSIWPHPPSVAFSETGRRRRGSGASLPPLRRLPCRRRRRRSPARELRGPPPPEP